ncbi:hypothetical protein D3C71_2124220 [compost metagenome]
MRQQRQIGPFGQRLRQRQRLIQNRFHTLFKLRRVRGAEEQTKLAFLQLIAQQTVGDSGVRL